MNKEKTGFEDARITEMFGEWKETIKDIEKLFMMIRLVRLSGKKVI